MPWFAASSAPSSPASSGDAVASKHASMAVVGIHPRWGRIRVMMVQFSFLIFSFCCGARRLVICSVL